MFIILRECVLVYLQERNFGIGSKLDSNNSLVALH